MATVKGYITLEKYVNGKTLSEMEQLLGLPAGELGQGAEVMSLKNLPNPAQFEPRAYTNLPGGQTFTGGKYPPGLRIPQWELTHPVEAIPIKSIPPGGTY